MATQKQVVVNSQHSFKFSVLHKKFGRKIATVCLSILLLLVLGFLSTVDVMAQTLPPQPSPRTYSTIAGVVRLDGKPAPDFTIRLDPTGKTAVTNNAGGYSFGFLGAGTYKVRVVNYDTTQVSPVNGDFRDVTLTGDDAQTGINFDFVTIAQPTVTATATATPTATPTATATPTPTATVPVITPTVAAPVTTAPAQPPVTTAPPPAPTTNVPTTSAQCPSAVKGQDLQISVQLCSSSRPDVTYIVINILNEADYPVDLSKTVVVDLPGPVVETLPAAGSISINGSSLVWSAGTLVPGQSTSLIVGVNTPAANIGSSVITVTGTFSTGEAFSRVINGIVPVTQVEPNTPGTNNPPRPANTPGNSGGASGTRPGALPATGQPRDNAGSSDLQLILLISLGVLILSLLGLMLWRLSRKADEQS